MSFQRNAIHELRKRVLTERRRFIQVVYGPRQVGKTTLVVQLQKDIGIPVWYCTADAVPVADFGWIRQQWETARMRVGDGRGLLIIDEIQKVTNWSEQVKKEWESDTFSEKNLHVILLGSSRLLLQQGLTESLAGRFEVHYCGHWSYAEMKAAFDFTPEQYVLFGGYPGAAELIHDEARWENYLRNSLIETSISKDVLMLANINKPALLRQLFELGTIYSGQILSYNKMVGQLQDAGNTTTLAHYLHLLSSAGLLSGISKYYPEKVRQRASSPKFQVQNTGLMTATSGERITSIRENPKLFGRWVESAIGAHLLDQSIQHHFKLWYWRDRNDEVDFVLEKGAKIIGIEVKSGYARPTGGMSAFQQRYDPFKILLVGDGGLPWQEFLEVNISHLF